MVLTCFKHVFFVVFTRVFDGFATSFQHRYILNVVLCLYFQQSLFQSLLVIFWEVFFSDYNLNKTYRHTCLEVELRKIDEHRPFLDSNGRSTLTSPHIWLRITSYLSLSRICFLDLAVSSKRSLLGDGSSPSWRIFMSHLAQPTGKRPYGYTTRCGLWPFGTRMMTEEKEQS